MRKALDIMEEEDLKEIQRICNASYLRVLSRGGQPVGDSQKLV
jgi:hypothetical protein